MADIFDLFRQIAKKEEPASAPVSWIVAGLGNPGAQYTYTRHNAGFLAVDALAASCGVRIDRVRFHALVGDGMIGASRVLFMKPQTMMNSSGTAVGEAAAFYHIPADHVLVISDDITQAPGRTRLRKKGSAGGHNGLKDIIAHLGTEEFPRIRVGVGEKPHPDYDLVDWVLGEIPEADRKKLAGNDPVIRETVALLLDGKADAAVQLCNSHVSE